MYGSYKSTTSKRKFLFNFLSSYNYDWFFSERLVFKHLSLVFFPSVLRSDNENDRAAAGPNGFGIVHVIDIGKDRENFDIDRHLSRDSMNSHFFALVRSIISCTISQCEPTDFPLFFAFRYLLRLLSCLQIINTFTLVRLDKQTFCYWWYDKTEAD